MNPRIKDALTGIVKFLAGKHSRRLFYLIIIALIALVEFVSLGLVRRTFVFYSLENGKPVVEDRMINRLGGKEINITRYVEETLLGPVSPNLAPLFPRETRLSSLMFRDGVVYADLSESAALLILGGGDLAGSLSTLEGGLRRNFSYIKEVQLFIAGNTTNR
jgi:hypothetical protein